VPRKFKEIFFINCKTCLNSGLIEFKRGECTYPNAPCPMCQYPALKKWLDRWCMDSNIAPFLWKHYDSLLPKKKTKQKRNLWRQTRHFFPKKLKKEPEDLPDEFLKSNHELLQ